MSGLTRRLMVEPKPTEPLLERLRRETRDLHDQLEHDLEWKRQVATLDSYRTLLTRWWGFYSAVEPGLEATFLQAGEASFFAPRRKLALLRQDLQHLGFCEWDVSGLPICAWSGPDTGLSGTLGTLYVLEGSTLGGQVIVRHVRRLLSGSRESQGCSFYDAYGPGAVGAMWQATRERIAKAAETEDTDAIVDAAKATFEHVRDWMFVSAP